MALLCVVLTSIGLLRTHSIMPCAARFMLLSLKRHYAKTLRSGLDQATTTYSRCLYVRLMSTF